MTQGKAELTGGEERRGEERRGEERRESEHSRAVAENRVEQQSRAQQ